MADIPNEVQYYKSDGTRVLTTGFIYDDVPNDAKSWASGYKYGSNGTTLKYYNSHINGETICKNWEELRSTGFYIGQTEIKEVTPESRFNFGKRIVDTRTLLGNGGTGTSGSYSVYYAGNDIKVAKGTEVIATYSSPLGIKPKYIYIEFVGAGGGGGSGNWNTSSGGGGGGGLYAGILDLAAAGTIYLTAQPGGSGGAQGNKSGESNGDNGETSEIWTSDLSLHINIYGGRGGQYGGVGGYGGWYDIVSSNYIKYTFLTKLQSGGGHGGDPGSAGADLEQLTFTTSNKLTTNVTHKIGKYYAGKYNSSSGGPGGASYHGDGGYAGGYGALGVDGQQGSYGAGGGGARSGFGNNPKGGNGGDASFAIWAFWM